MWNGRDIHTADTLKHSWKMQAATLWTRLFFFPYHFPKRSVHWLPSSKTDPFLECLKSAAWASGRYSGWLQGAWAKHSVEAKSAQTFFFSIFTSNLGKPRAAIGTHSSFCEQSLHFSIEISTFALLSIEISTSSLLFVVLYTQRRSLDLLLPIILRTQNFNINLCPAWGLHLLPPIILRTRKFAKKNYAQHSTQHTASQTTSFHDVRAQIYCENAAICTVPCFQTSTLSHACHTNCNLLAELPPHDWAIQLFVTTEVSTKLPLTKISELWFKTEKRKKGTYEWL